MMKSLSHLPSAVDVRGAEKCYGKKSDATMAFTNLNLKLPRGNIYGLLGPSGCGKTTLLRCILGRLKLDKGSVLVFGHQPGTKESGIPGAIVGYVAQDTTVYLTMTIGEYFRYFGTILGLSSKEIQSKSEYLIHLLRLPSKDTLTSNLSGGQLRCVQFGAACIHSPKLLILDEPTVGIDVITKQRIWDHLIKLTRNNDTSILLTTHYIEEAKLADRVGMLHGKTMADEDTTENLLAKYKENNLEAIFLKICYQESFKVVTSNGEQSQVFKGKTMTREHGQSLKRTKNKGRLSILESGGSDCVLEKPHKLSTSKSCGLNLSWHRLYPIMMRTFISLYRFPGVLLLLILLPSSQVFTYTNIMSNSIGGVGIAVVNNDVGKMGAHYLSFLNPVTIVQKVYNDYDAGLEAVRRGEMYGMLYIKSNFSEVVIKRFTDLALINDETVKAGTIEIQMDNTNLHIAKFAEFHMLHMFQHFLYDSLDLAGHNPAASSLPINISKATLDNLTQPPSLYVLSGEILLASFFSPIPVAIFNIFMERHKGYMEPNLIAGVTPAEIVLGMFLGQFVILIFQVGGVILAAPPLLSSANKGSLFLIFCLLYVQGICGTSLGVLYSLICDQVLMLFQATSAIICLGAGLTGVFWPMESMPTFFSFICQLLPTALPGRAIALIVHRGWNLYHFSILSAFAVSFIWTFIFLAFAFLFFYLKV